MHAVVPLPFLLPLLTILPLLLLLLLMVLPCPQVRIRGVAVGSVLTVRPSLDKVDVLVEVRGAAGLCRAAAVAAALSVSWLAGMHSCQAWLSRHSSCSSTRQTERQDGWLWLHSWRVHAINCRALLAVSAAAVAGVDCRCWLLWVGRACR